MVLGFIHLMTIQDLRHPKDGYKITFKNLLVVETLFKIRCWDDSDRDFCVYRFLDEKGRVRYIGMGRFYFGAHFFHSRPFIHCGDLLKLVVNPGWTCEILVTGVTGFEARVLESYLIREQLEKGMKLSKKGAKVLEDEGCLVNKRREHKYEAYTNEYLNIGNGNNTGIAA